MSKQEREPDWTEHEEAGSRNGAVADDDRTDARSSETVDVEANSRPRSQLAHFQPEEQAPRAVSRAIRSLLNRYELNSGSSLPGIIAVVSALHGEGVTTVSKALAEILTIDTRRNACWVDLSWASDQPSPRRPKEDPHQPGIAEVLGGGARIDEIAHEVEGNPRLFHISGGDVPRGRWGSVARSVELHQAVDDLKGRFAHLVIDCPPVLAAPEGLAVVQRADAYLLVAHYGVTTTSQVESIQQQLASVPSLGAVLNQYRTKTPRVVRRLLGA